MASDLVTTAGLEPLASRRSVAAHVADVWRFRELLRQLVRKELKVRYRSSALGFVWSMLNPLFLLAVYALAFSVLGAGFQDFPIWLITGLVVWGLFASAVVQGTTSITGNSYLVGKVRFPREVLPLAAVGASLVHFVLQLAVVFALLLAVGHSIAWSYLWLVVPATLALVVLAAALAILLAAANVYARDVQHLLDLAVIAWFWLTAILYPITLLTDWLNEKGLPVWLAYLNPVNPIVMAFQRTFYGSASVPDAGAPGGVKELLPDASVWWYARNLAIVLLAATLLLALAVRVFDRADVNLAENV
jgi:ABC-type polysaccharide/polyol phosphate export permease